MTGWQKIKETDASIEMLNVYDSETHCADTSLVSKVYWKKDTKALNIDIVLVISTSAGDYVFPIIELIDINCETIGYAIRIANAAISSKGLGLPKSAWSKQDGTSTLTCFKDVIIDDRLIYHQLVILSIIPLKVGFAIEYSSLIYADKDCHSLIWMSTIRHDAYAIKYSEIGYILANIQGVFRLCDSYQKTDTAKLGV